MKRIIRLCQSVIRGTEDPHPGDDRSYVCKKSGKSATAISTAVVATATEAGQEQNPDQPFATIISAATVVFIAQKSAAVVAATVTAATAAEQ